MLAEGYECGQRFPNLLPRIDAALSAACCDLGQRVTHAILFRRFVPFFLLSILVQFPGAPGRFSLLGRHPLHECFVKEVWAWQNALSEEMWTIWLCRKQLACVPYAALDSGCNTLMVTFWVWASGFLSGFLSLSPSGSSLFWI